MKIGETFGIKFDFLLTNGISLLQLCMEMLVKDGFMEWQGNLRDTYKKYLLPSAIDMTNKKIWDDIKNARIMNLFQFETPVGREAIRKLQPSNLLDLANANSLMRLMSPNGEQPIDKYIRFKNNPNEWDKEMIEFGLDDRDREILHKELDNQYGVCSNQESMMEMFMNPNIGNMGIKEVNGVRKAVAKKKPKLLQQFEKEFYNKAKELNVSEALAKYCWEIETGYQRGYSFSLLHTCAYSTIGVQEAHIFVTYPKIYWYTANLISMSGSLEKEEIEDNDFEIKEKTTKYGKVAKAISDIQLEGVKVEYPNINKSDLGFIPNLENNSILFGLKGITSINEEACQTIINNRPYKNMNDFYNRLVATKREVTLSTGKKQMKQYISNKQMENLIKGGCFDELENKSREELLLEFIKLLNPDKQKLTAKDIENMNERGMIPSEYSQELACINFRKFISNLKKHKDKDVKSISWSILECGEDTDYTTEFFLNNFANDMEEDRDYYYDENGIINVALGTKRKGSFDNIYNKKIEPLNKWLKTKDCIDYYNKTMFDEVKKDYTKGGISKWEMESISYYYHDHELTKANNDKYEISNFFELPQEPIITDYNTFTNKKTKEVVKYPIYELTNIVGTVLDRDKNKHTVTILTPNGVTNIKFYSGQFTFYDKNISIDGDINPKTGKAKKITLEEGWFKKGNLIFVTGFRRNDNFYPKRYKNSIYQHTVQLIKEIKDNGDLVFQSDRTKI